MKPKIKFCGMRRKEDIEIAESLNIDFVGFVFVPSSPRAITPEEVALIRRSMSSVSVVGVFVSPTIEEIKKAVQIANLQYVQIYNNIPSGAIEVPIIRAFRGVPSIEILEQTLQQFSYILIDKAEGQESVHMQDLEKIPYEILSKTFIAGGVNAKNIKRAMQFQPFALDTARGIESSPGIKDPALMKEFLSTVHS